MKKKHKRVIVLFFTLTMLLFGTMLKNVNNEESIVVADTNNVISLTANNGNATIDSENLTATFTAGSVVTFQITFTGPKTITFNYSMENTGNVTAYLDDNQMGSNIGNWAQYFFNEKDDSKAKYYPYGISIDTEGEHTFKFVVSVSYTGSLYLNKFFVKDLNISDGAEYSTININIDDRLGYIKYQDKEYHNGDSFQVLKYNNTENFERVPYENIISTIDNETKTYAKRVEANISVDGELMSKKYITGAIDYDTGNDLKKSHRFFGDVVDYNIVFKEVLLSPKEIIVARYIEDVFVDSNIMVNNGEVSVPYDKKNNIYLKVSKYENFSETIKLYINKQLYSMDFAVGYWGLILSNIGVDKNVSVVVSLDGYNDSDTIEFKIKAVADVDLQDLVQTSNVVLQNDDSTYQLGSKYDGFVSRSNAWVFAPEYSSASTTVYRPGNGGEYVVDGKKCYNAAVSNLKMTVTGSGIISFVCKYIGIDYSDDSIFTALMYNIGEKVTISGNYSYYADNGEKLWYNNELVATGMSKELSDGWYKVEIPIDASDDISTDVYLAFIKAVPDDLNFYIKEISFLQGTATTSFSVLNGVGGQIKVDATIQNGENKENITETKINGLVKNIVKGSTTTFTAKASTGYKFFAFVDKNNNVLSYNETYFISQVDDFVIKAVFIKTSDVARIGFETYSSLKDAINSAKVGDTIYLLNNTTITENLTIPNGVKLVMPIEIDGTYTQVGTTKNAQSTASFNNPEKYLLNTLTINSGVTLTVDGEFVIGAVQHYVEQFAQGITSGKYNQVLNNGNIIVNGELRVYGLIDGIGKIELNGGATLYEPYLVNNFSGGTDTEALYNANQFPFEQYDTINIRTELKVNYDARVIGMTSLYFWGTTNIQDVDLIGKDVGLIQLTKPNSYIISTYNKDKYLKNSTDEKLIDLADSGKRTLHIYGGAVAGNFSIQGYGSKGMFLAIPYTFDIYLHNGTYEIPEGYGYKVMPGANFVVEEDATLNVNGKLLVYSTFVNSSMDGKIYPSTKNLTDYGFDINGVFVINGTLNINGSFAGYIQSKVVGATINVNENAILDIDVVNGAKSEYDCNIVEFNLKAKIITENGNFATIEKNKSYKTTIIGSKQTSSTTFNYVINTTKDEADSTLTTKLGVEIRYHKMINYIDNSSITINGIWAEVHEHSYVIDTITYATENTNGYVKYHCSNETCNYEIEKTLLYLPTILGTYTYTGEEIEVLFNNFDKNTMEIVNPQIFKNAGQYLIQIALKDFENYAWSRENVFDNILELNFTIDKKQAQINSFNVDDNSGIVKNGNVLEVVYSGNEYNVVGFIQDGRLVEITYLSSANRVNVGEYRVKLVARENGNYKKAELEITLKIVKKYFEYNFADKQVDYTGIPKNAGEFIPLDFTKNYDLLVKFGNKYVQEITTAGTYLIIVTIDEANYFGTYTFNVIVNKIDVDFDLEDIKDKMIVKANSISFASLNNIEYSINGVDYSIGAKVFENLNALQTYTIYVKHLGDDNHNDTIKTFKQKTTRKAQDVNNLINSLPEEMNVKQETFGLFKQINSMILEVSSYEQDQIDKTKLNEKIAEYNKLVEKVNDVANEAKEISNRTLIFRTKVYAICGNGTSNAFNIMLTLNTLATAIGVVFLISKRKFLG